MPRTAPAEASDYALTYLDVRLAGTSAKCMAAAEMLRQIPGLTVVQESENTKIDWRWATALALTERELQVLAGMAAGYTNAEIGRKLHISAATVKMHSRKLYRKLGVRRRTDAVALGVRAGLLPPGVRAGVLPPDAAQLFRRVRAAKNLLDKYGGSNGA